MLGEREFLHHGEWVSASTAKPNDYHVIDAHNRGALRGHLSCAIRQTTDRAVAAAKRPCRLDGDRLRPERDRAFWKSLALRSLRPVPKIWPKSDEHRNGCADGLARNRAGSVRRIPIWANFINKRERVQIRTTAWRSRRQTNDQSAKLWRRPA